MRCPFCGLADSKVLDTRPSEEGFSIRRRRECLKCGRRFTTFEKVEEMPIILIKKDGQREMFDSRKLLGGLIKACHKRPVSLSQLEELVEEIERELSSSLEREVSSREVGELVMSKLKELDEVAYVRFASVYRQFTDINTFLEAIKQLQRNDSK